MGEFVFDHAWASAAQRAGIDYYPKLLVGVPFTPVTGARFLAGAGRPAARARPPRAACSRSLCASSEFSSVHVNFCRPADVEALTARGWLHRIGYQYQWRNEGFRTFDDYLDEPPREAPEPGASRAPRARRAGRRDPQARGIATSRRTRRRSRTSSTARRSTTNSWGQRYLTRRVFELVFERWRERLCLVLAYRGGRGHRRAP